ncbi:MAG: pilus assembly protein [Planctomycetota bacterium]|nr:pilus assembly protein [Planctomycetota bacterium]MDA1137914.1 pilus assembly protein [Planctomycetota bacterium]
MKFIRRRNGSAAIEFAISLPMYLILFFGILFFGQSSFIDQEMNLARAFATFSQGDVSDGYLNANVISGYLGQLNVQAHASTRAPSAGTDLDGDGTIDRYVTSQRLTVSDQTEHWSDHSRNNGNPASLFNTGDFYQNTGPYSNFRMDHSQIDVENNNTAWAENTVTVLHYDYTPDFAHFIFGEPNLTQAQYLTYQLGGPVTTQSCRGCHSSYQIGTNNRWETRLYRSRQGGNRPLAGEERRLWSYLKSADMRRVLAASNYGATDNLPPADVIQSDGTLERPEQWDNRAVVNYDTSIRLGAWRLVPAGP